MIKGFVVRSGESVTSVNRKTASALQNPLIIKSPPDNTISIPAQAIFANPCH